MKSNYYVGLALWFVGGMMISVALDGYRGMFVVIGLCLMFVGWEKGD